MLLVPCDLIKVMILCKHRFLPSNQGPVLWFLYHMYLFLVSVTVKCCYFFQDALKRNSARQIRFAFLLHAWNATLDYSENVLREAEQTDKLFNVRLNFCYMQYSLGKAQKTPSNKCYKLLSGRGVVFRLGPSLTWPIIELVVVFQVSINNLRVWAGTIVARKVMSSESGDLRMRHEVSK